MEEQNQVPERRSNNAAKRSKAGSSSGSSDQQVSVDELMVPPCSELWTEHMQMVQTVYRWIFRHLAKFIFNTFEWRKLISTRLVVHYRQNC
ncbi:hypothetical protein EXN66_Car019606 [Channa argus]|uniref:Uncharacterized protein n=1 Tax=Channa argus TaxID=215402 RepID=A0A6G1QNW5_CHAAH|nr:hypothetical protein EXN66_Car019606 [Channa argus]